MSFHQLAQPVIVDASAAVEFLIGEPAWVDRWAAWADSDVVLLAPTHFAAEVANALLRSARMPAAEVALQLGRLARSGVESVDRQLPGLLESVDLADEHGLTVYDALYLQLALDVEGELATLDKDLRRAAIAEDLTVTD